MKAYMNNSITIEILTKEKMLQYINQIMSISKDAFKDKSWSKAQFMYELPDKWRLSSMVKYENEVVGFRVDSSYSLRGYKTAHMHYIAILEKYRGMGFSKKIHIFTKYLCVNADISQMTTETTEGVSHSQANRTFEKIGYVRIRDKDLIIDYLKAKNKIDLLPQYIEGISKIYIIKNIEL